MREESGESGSSVSETLLSCFLLLQVEKKKTGRVFQRKRHVSYWEKSSVVGNRWDVHCKFQIFISLQVQLVG